MSAHHLLEISVDKHKISIDIDDDDLNRMINFVSLLLSDTDDDGRLFLKSWIADIDRLRGSPRKPEMATTIDEFLNMLKKSSC